MKRKKAKEKKTISTAVVSIIMIIILAVTLICISIFVDLKEEKKLNDEIKSINAVMTDKQFNQKKFDKYTSRTVSNGEYKIIEKAYKSFLKDNQETIDKITEFFKNSKSPTLLSFENIKNDGKEFTKSIEMLDNDKQTLQKLQNEYKRLNTKENVMSYIKGKDLSDYYVTYYKNKIANNVAKTNSEKILNERISDNLKLIDKSKNILEFLAKNKNSWQTDDKTIYFYTDELTNEYNKLLGELKK